VLLELFLLLALPSAAPAQPTDPAQTPVEVAPQLSQEELGAALVEKLAALCATHPEVERAFVISQSDAAGKVTFMFIPIFDRKVSDELLNEADIAYQELAPGRGHLPLMLLARNTWKKSLGGAPPIYVRPRK
jgi:hypothetical protein